MLGPKNDRDSVPYLLCLPIVFIDYYFDQKYILNERFEELNVFNIAGELP